MEENREKKAKLYYYRAEQTSEKSEQSFYSYFLVENTDEIYKQREEFNRTYDYRNKITIVKIELMKRTITENCKCSKCEMPLTTGEELFKDSNNAEVCYECALKDNWIMCENNEELYLEKDEDNVEYCAQCEEPFSYGSLLECDDGNRYCEKHIEEADYSWNDRHNSRDREESRWCER